MMEAARTSETLVIFYQTALRYNPEDRHLRGYSYVRFIEDTYKLIGRYLLMGVPLHEAVAFSVEGTFQRAKEGVI
jgi:hypothetical protein